MVVLIPCSSLRDFVAWLSTMYIENQADMHAIGVWKLIVHKKINKKGVYLLKREFIISSHSVTSCSNWLEVKRICKLDLYLYYCWQPAVVAQFWIKTQVINWKKKFISNLFNSILYSKEVVINAAAFTNWDPYHTESFSGGFNLLRRGELFVSQSSSSSSSSSSS